MTRLFELKYIDPKNKSNTFDCKPIITTDPIKRIFISWFPAAEMILFLNPTLNYKTILKKIVRPNFKSQYQFLGPRAMEAHFWQGVPDKTWKQDTWFINTVAIEMIAMQAENTTGSKKLVSCFSLKINEDNEKNLRFVNWLRQTFHPTLSLDIAKIKLHKQLQLNEIINERPETVIMTIKPPLLQPKLSLSHPMSTFKPTPKPTTTIPKPITLGTAPKTTIKKPIENTKTSTPHQKQENTKQSIFSPRPVPKLTVYLPPTVPSSSSSSFSSSTTTRLVMSLSTTSGNVTKTKTGAAQMSYYERPFSKPPKLYLSNGGCDEEKKYSKNALDLGFNILFSNQEQKYFKSYDQYGQNK